MVDLSKKPLKALELQKKVEELKEEIKSLKQQISNLNADMATFKNIATSAAMIAVNPYQQAMQSAMFSPIQSASPVINPYYSVTDCCCNYGRDR